MIRKKIGISDVVITIILIFTALICIVPVLNTVAMSLSDKDSAGAGKVFLWPVNFTVVPYEELSKEPLFIKSFLNSVCRVVLGVIINVVLTILAAYPLSKTKRAFKAKYVYLWFIVFTMLFNAGLVPNFVLVQKLGLIDSIWALVLPGSVPVFSVIVLMNYFKGIPESLEEAAFMDGANPFRILWTIYVPMSKPSIAVVAIFSIVNHWNTFFDGLIYINSDTKRPLQTYIQQLTFSVDYQRLGSMNPQELLKQMQMSSITFNCAKIVVSLLPITIMYLLLQRYFVSGVVVGAVKE